MIIQKALQKLGCIACCKVWTRSLLIAASSEFHKPRVDVFEARQVLKNIIGQSTVWGKERDASVLNIKLATSQDDLPKKKMLDSYQELVIPLKSEPKTRSKYLNYYGGVRIGKILEALDTLSVLVSYTHNENVTGGEYKSPLCIVTAFVDQIVLQPDSLSSNNDILLRGHVTWVGTSSMEVTLEVTQCPVEEQAGEWRHIMDARFMMVARDTDNTKKAIVYPLLVETAEEQELFTKGELNKQRQLKQSRQSLLKSPPNEEERHLIHNLFLGTLQEKAATFRNPIRPEGSVWLDDTKLKNLIVCFPDQRNLYNKMFGGFLMRVAYELGWTCATVLSKGRVVCTAMDDIMFWKPVEIGCLLYLSSLIVYSSGEELQARVHAQVLDPKTGSQETTNVFHFTFKSINGNVPSIMPKSYAEYMMYLDGKRHYEA